MRSALLWLALWDTGLLLVFSVCHPHGGVLSSFTHRELAGSRRPPALDGIGLGVNEGEALEDRRLAPLRNPARTVSWAL